MCHACTVSLFFDTFGQKARCQEPDVDPDWWVEPDLDLEDVLRSEGEARAPHTVANSLAIGSRVNNLRAKILCYECPLIDACRNAGWDEGYHVWGGLDPNERYQVRVGQTYAVLPSPKRPRYAKYEWRERPGVKRFLAGDPIEEIADELGVTPPTVLDTMRGVLATLRSPREGSEEWRSQQPLPPSVEMSRESFRHGRAVSSTSEGEWGR